MSLRQRCLRCGSTACTTMCMLLGGSLYSTPVWSQTVDPGSRPTPISSIATVDIATLSDLLPPQPLLSAAAPFETWCMGGRCFRGVIVVRANHRWQLQARLDPGRAPMGAVMWHPALSGAADVPLSTGTWTTILPGGMPTGGMEVVLRFSVPGTDETMDAVALSTLLQYRVVPLP